MVGHQWFHRIEPPTRRREADAHSCKQEQDTGRGFLCSRNRARCVAVCPLLLVSSLCLLLFIVCTSVSVLYFDETNRKSMKLFDTENRSSPLVSLSKTNLRLTTENEVLKERSSHLDHDNRILNRTWADLQALNLDLSLKSAELTERIRNLTSEKVQLRRENENLLEVSSDLEDQRSNLSQTLNLLLRTNAALQEEKRQLSDASRAMSGETIRVKQENEELLGVNLELQERVQNLSQTVRDFPPDEFRQLQETVTRLREENRNLSTLLDQERLEEAELEEQRAMEAEKMAADLQSATEAYRSLDRYCPVVHQQSRERVCRKCQEGWKQLGSTCYYFSSRTGTWRDSQSWCRTQGGDLLVVNSEEEQRFVSDGSRTRDPSGTRLWIGLTDQDQEGAWLWVDGSKLSADLQFWLSRAGEGAEPDNWKQVDPEGEDCGHLDTSEDTLRNWMDGSCQTSYRWICEKKL